jgi:hypothetical protein
MTDRRHYNYNTRALLFACATRMRSHVSVCVWRELLSASDIDCALSCLLLLEHV